MADKHPHIAFTVTDHFFSAGFYRKSGDYDFWRLLISKDKSAIRFGRDLFEYYKSISEKVF
ncbi:transcriptional regulator FilR1 domain-containing protein [Geoglobus ahangari]|uniref:transcriptional regulator FilR1 domain-containing protein n=1 Tax=Geoglobus ahangari TaxID=113653 RepID=UPI000A01E88E